MKYFYDESSCLVHYGVKGMKWNQHIFEKDIEEYTKSNKNAKSSSLKTSVNNKVGGSQKVTNLKTALTKKFLATKPPSSSKKTNSKTTSLKDALNGKVSKSSNSVNKSVPKSKTIEEIKVEKAKIIALLNRDIAKMKKK